MMEADIAALGSAAREGLREVERAARQLGERTVEQRSETGAVVAVVTLHGRLIDLTLRTDALQEYDSATLGELLATTIRDGQTRAHEEYDEAVRAATPAATLDYLERLRRACRA
jgi:DNA-binding protein YbaB